MGDCAMPGRDYPQRSRKVFLAGIDDQPAGIVVPDQDAGMRAPTLDLIENGRRRILGGMRDHRAVSKPLDAKFLAVRNPIGVRSPLKRIHAPAQA